MSGGVRQLRISAWAIRNPVPVAVLFIALVIAGVFSYFLLPVKNFPNIDFPVVVVTVTQNGAAPSELKTQVTRPLEDALQSLTNVNAISSDITQGESDTRIQFNIGTDMMKATDDVRAKVEQERAQLPREIDPPTVTRFDIEGQPIVTYAVSPAPGVSMSDAQLSWLVDNDIARTLQGVPGVAQVQRVGGVNREINVIVDPVRMAAQGVTAPTINQALNNVSIDESGGRVDVGHREQTLRVLGAAVNVHQIRNLALPAAGGRYVKLSDVAEVGDGTAEIRAEARYDGRPVVGFQVTKTQEASDVSTEDGVDAALDRMVHGARPGLFGGGAPATNPQIRIRKIVSTVDETRGSFAATRETMLEGMALAALVVFLFLRDWRATAVTAIAMPVSLIPTFAFMALAGFSLNVVTLLALTLVIGILVDDAIVEIENIEKRVHAGVRPYAAAMEGADQIGLAVVATTSAIIVVFTPVSFMPGIPGQFFREFGLTVSVAVLFSLVVARLLTPLLAAYFLKPKPARPRAPLPRFYTATLGWALDHRIASASLGAAIFLVSVVLALFVVPKGLQPEGNPNFYQVDLNGPPGATLQDTQLAMSRLAALLKRQPETEHVFTSIGSGGGASAGGGFASAGGVNTGVAIAILKPSGRPTVAQIRDRLRPALHAIPDAQVTFEGSGFGGSTIFEYLSSSSGRGLDLAALKLQQQMAGLPALADPRPAASPPAPELIIRPRPDDAARLGVDADTIAQVARIATVGDIDANVPKLDLGDRRIPIRVRLPESARDDLATLKAMRVPTANGGLTTLDSVADVYFQAGPAEIDRYNRKDDIVIEADLTKGAALSQANQEVGNLPIIRHLPPGVTLERNIGNQQAQNQLFVGFGVAILSGIGLVYGVMVLLFGSFFKPVTILSALPLSIAGAMVALLIWRSELSIPSMIGLFMLMGIAAKNSILLVEYAIERERAGASQREALLEACRERARPIVMTTFAMMAGMLPTAMGLGQGHEFRQPMAVAVIGGLITSTALSLVLAPTVYEFVDDFERWLKPKLGRLVTPRDAPLEPAAATPD
ncbi:MAG TPA: efflux RND transporter permease subunit [Caulobacteraceae bacterium]|nr:efflux RND transporter permease subunit [Caulobacteraceae bacterium]